jgi:hypothetical protein
MSRFHSASIVKKKIKNIFFLILIVPISFLAIEALLRGAYELRNIFRANILFDFYKNKEEIVYDASDKYGPSDYPRYEAPPLQYSSFLEYIPRKNSTVKGVHVNQYHLRYDEDFPKIKEANEIRIFVTGGSTAFGQGVSQSDTYAYVLEKSLRTQYPKLKIRVIIAAVGGYVSTQERIFFENIVLSLNPDIVMMLSGQNDTYFGYRGSNIMYEHDFFEIKKGLQGKIKRLPIEKGDINYFVDPPKYQDYDSKILLFIDKFLYKKKFPNKATLQKAISELSIEPKSVYSFMTRNIHIIKTLCDSIGSKFIFYLQPALFATEKNKLSKFETYMHTSMSTSNFIVGFAAYNYKVYQIYRKLLPVEALNNGYIFVNGDDAIKFEEKTVFIDEVHFDDRGNRLLAEHMFKVLNPLIDEISTKRTAAQH